MTAFYRTDLPSGESLLQEIEVGGTLEVNGRRMRVLSVSIEPAAEDDPDMGVWAGDPVTTISLEPLEPDPLLQGLWCPRCDSNARPAV